MLKERIDPVSLGYALFSFVGVICVSRPTFIFGKSADDEGKNGSVFAVMCALLGAAGQAVVYVSMRRLQQLNFIVVINYFLLTASVISGLSLVIVEHVRFCNCVCLCTVDVLTVAMMLFCRSS